MGAPTVEESSEPHENSLHCLDVQSDTNERDDESFKNKMAMGRRRASRNINVTVKVYLTANGGEWSYRYTDS